MSRAVITGMGAIAPNALGVEEYWMATLEARSGIDRIARFDPSPYPSVLGGEVTGFEAADHVPGRLLVETSRMSHFAFVAAEAALHDAGLRPEKLAEQEYKMGVATANSTGGVEFGQHELQKLWSQGPDDVSAYLSIAWFYAATTGQLSIRHKMRGQSNVLVSEQAGGLDVIGHGRRLLRNDHRMMLVGGTESGLSPAGLVSHVPMGLLSTRTDPDRAYLPFDADANGHVPGEGGAMLVLEEESAARSRGVSRCHGEVVGHAATFDPPPDSGRPPALRRAIELALADAQLDAEGVDLVLADGAGVAGMDLEEAEALTKVFGPAGVPVTVPKALTGRLYAGSGPLDTVTALSCLRKGVIPPTPNVTEAARGCEMDLVLGKPRERRMRNALVLARGHGGFNAALLLSGPRDLTP